MSSQVTFNTSAPYTATGREVLLEYIGAGGGGASTAQNAAGGGGGGYGARNLVNNPICVEGEGLTFSPPDGGASDESAEVGSFRNETTETDYFCEEEGSQAGAGGNSIPGGGGVVDEGVFPDTQNVGGDGDYVGVGTSGGGGGSSASAAGIGESASGITGATAPSGGGNGGNGGSSSSDGSNGAVPGGGGGGAGDGGVSTGGTGGHGKFVLTVAAAIVMTSSSSFTVAVGDTAVGAVTATGDGPLLYDIVGGQDDALFQINGSTGVLAFIHSAQAGTYHITVRITDDWGLYADNVLTVRVSGGDGIDSLDPTSWPGLYQ